MVPVAITPAYGNMDLSSEEMSQIGIGSSVLYAPGPNSPDYLHYSHVTTVVGFGWTDEMGRAQLAPSYQDALATGASADSINPYVMDRGMRETEDGTALPHLQYPYPMNTDVYDSMFYAIWSPVPEEERDLRRTIAQSTPALILPHHIRAATEEAYWSDQDGEWIPQNWPSPVVEYCDIPNSCIGTGVGWVDDIFQYINEDDPDWHWDWYWNWINTDN
jgi:hypothetical protein